MKTIKGIIDRFEGEIAAIEAEGKMHNFPRTMFPEDASPGDFVEITEGQARILKEETDSRRTEIEALMKEVWEE